MKLTTYNVTLTRTETRVRTITIQVEAESRIDAAVLAKYKDVPSYQWLCAQETTDEKTVIGDAEPAPLAAVVEPVEA